MIIRLTESELTIAYTVAIQRLAQNMALGRKRTHGRGSNSLQDHVIGCVSEMALASYFRRYWNGNVGDIRAKDVGNLQMRATERLNGSLILHREDPDQDRFFFAVVNGAVVDIKGFMFGHAGKIDRYWRNEDASHGIVHAAYFVPAGDLDPVPEWTQLVNGSNSHA